MSTATADDLAGIVLFDILALDERAAIAPWFELYGVSAGVTLTGEGGPGYSFFVLRLGSATVTINGVEVRTLGPGDSFGELALLGEGRRTATVMTASPSEVLVLFGTEFRRIQQEYPELAARIEASLRDTAQPAST